MSAATGNTADNIVTGLTLADRRFLDRPRMGFLTVAPEGKWPLTAPVWFETFDGGVHLATADWMKKVGHIRATSWASLVAANDVGEPEHWVRVSGPARIERDGGGELIGRLAARYWDLSDQRLAATVDAWLADPAQVRIVIEGEHVTRYAG